MRVNPYSLGATLYMPATRPDITDVILRNKIPHLKSLSICLEDAITDADVKPALENLQNITAQISQKHLSLIELAQLKRPLIFVRPRNLDMATRLVNQYDLSGVDGFVLPKFSLSNLKQWESLIAQTHLLIMPTLETADVFNGQIMQQLAQCLHTSRLKKHVVVIRIGGNDLMSVLGIRRSRTATLYEGPLSYVIKMLVCTFGAYGFSLTSPVFELLHDPALLQKELEMDLLHGLVGKTAIHPTQIEQIQSAWMVEHIEYEEAAKIIDSDQAVFQQNGAMCEPATHRKWAENIITRSQCYGLKPSVVNPLDQIQMISA